MSNPTPSHERKSVELYELSPDLLARLVDGELHLYTQSLLDDLDDAKTVDDFEEALNQATIVELDPDEMYGIFRLLGDHYEQMIEDYSDVDQTIH